jgi:hypothetical protein
MRWKGGGSHFYVSKKEIEKKDPYSPGVFFTSLESEFPSLFTSKIAPKKKCNLFSIFFSVLSGKKRKRKKREKDGRNLNHWEF